jgi:hypothetical protein
MRHLLPFLRLSFCGLLLLLLAATASAQFRAGVQGSVTDTQGGAIIGATVTLTNSETGKTQQATTSDEGFYRFTGLAPGKYTITVEQTGFSKKTLENVAVNAEAVEGVDVQLEAGAVTAAVTVSDTLGPQLETENADISKAITTQEVRTLPQFGRDPYELTRLTPGVFGDFARGGTGGAVNLPNQTGPGGTRGDRLIFQTENQPQISANGQRVTSNNFQIDGTSVNSLTHGGAAVITPNQESVKEIRVVANSYSAEYGRNSGAQILTVSQNGTNQFHGSLFLKNNSPGLNAFNKYGGFNNAAPVRNEQHYNQYGGSIGGPIPIPRFGEGKPPAFRLGRNRAFFFFSFEALRNNTVGTFTGFVETAEFRQLVTSTRQGSVTARILSAAGIEPRLINAIPITCAAAGFNATNCRQVNGGLDIGSPAGAAGQYISFGNLQGGGFDGVPDVLFGQFAAPNTSRGKQFNPRIDFNLTDKDTLTLSSYFSRFNAVQADTDVGGGARPMADITTKPSNYFATLTYIRTISATLLNEARFNFTRFSFNEVESSSQTNFGIPRIEIETLPFARIKFGAPFSETTPGIFAENTFEFRDTLRIARGNKGLSFGAEIRKEQNNNNLGGGDRPLFTFGGLFNFANSTPLFYQINADPRTGGPADAARAFRTSTYGFFGQDDWKIRPNFTLNLGLRWDYFSPLSDATGKLSNFVFGPPGQELTGGTIQVVNRLYNPDRNNFAPRVGFAWSPKGIAGIETAERLVIRGGAGIAYDRIPVNVFENVRGNPPFFARWGICCGTSASDFSTPFNNGQILYALGASNSPFSFPANPALRLTFNPTTGIPNVPPGAQIELYGATPDVPTPMVYAYSLEGQYSLPAKLTAELGYQGSTGRHLVRLIDQRFLYPNPNDFFAVRIIFPLTDTNANYNAMIARLSRRFAQGFQFDAVYRWAKSIDIVSSEQVGAPNPTFPLDPAQERGPSDYDVRHNFVMSGLWELPLFRHRNDALGKLLGGWQLSSIATFHTGFPWTPIIGQCVSTRGPQLCPTRPAAYSGGVGNDTSNNAFINGTNTANCFVRDASGNIIPNMSRCFDVSAPNGRLPGVGRNSFRGPNYRDIDLSLAKRFGVPGFFGEGAFFEFKANFFNIFNILNLQSFGFNTPSTQVTSPNFGRAERGLSGRVIEIQGRFSF